MLVATRPATRTSPGRGGDRPRRGARHRGGDRQRRAGRRAEPGLFLLAIDGRSSSGKSTLSRRIAERVAGTAVVHTDDIAWWHSRFGWEDLLITGVIEPLRRGLPVAYRPPAWELRGRAGSVRVPAAARLVVIEGVGAGRTTLAPLVDAIAWVQSDRDITERRDAKRVVAGELDQAGYDGWMSEEIPFQALERTWQRADLVIAGSPSAPHDPSTQIVVLRQGRAGRA